MFVSVRVQQHRSCAVVSGVQLKSPHSTKIRTNTHSHIAATNRTAGQESGCSFYVI